MTIPAQKPARKLSMKQRYAALTHDLDWTPTYVREEEVFPTPRSRASRSTTGPSGRTRSD